jgi:hypothetical protein
LRVHEDVGAALQFGVDAARRFELEGAGASSEAPELPWADVISASRRGCLQRPGPAIDTVFSCGP